MFLWGFSYRVFLFFLPPPQQATLFFLFFSSLLNILHLACVSHGLEPFYFFLSLSLFFSVSAELCLPISSFFNLPGCFYPI